MAINNRLNELSTGIVVLKSSGATTAVTVTGTSNQIAISNGNGTSGNPTASLSSTIQVSGISFDSGSNTLSSYSTGTFTPTIDASTSSPTVGYSVQIGRYTIIGNRVFVNVTIMLSSISGGTGNAQVSGLPFTSNASSATVQNYASLENVTIAAGRNYVMSSIAAAKTNFGLNAVRPGSTTAALAIGTVAANSNFYLSCSYEI